MWTLNGIKAHESTKGEGKQEIRQLATQRWSEYKDPNCVDGLRDLVEFLVHPEMATSCPRCGTVGKSQDQRGATHWQKMLTVPSNPGTHLKAQSQLCHFASGKCFPALSNRSASVQGATSRVFLSGTQVIPPFVHLDAIAILPFQIADPDFLNRT